MLVTGFHHIFLVFLKDSKVAILEKLQQSVLADTVFRELYSQSFHNLVNVNMQKGKWKKEIFHVAGVTRDKGKLKKLILLLRLFQKYLNNVC